ncbi:hypothetical protein EVG20_g822 [Dentipellis fragilis]|uniref:Uncharacterized protein n=1 Tax=Dentipellis fragilis TaxID=205917 RepID=A0A4Y9ZDX7_9AGAM|nr:hypothetical protein EVG20_g822 [Dentipellis fragilis]
MSGPYPLYNNPGPSVGRRPKPNPATIQKLIDNEVRIEQLRAWLQRNVPAKDLKAMHEQATAEFNSRRDVYPSDPLIRGDSEMANFWLSVLVETYDTLYAMYRANEECADNIAARADTNCFLLEELETELAYLKDMAGWDDDSEEEEEGGNFMSRLDEGQMEALMANLAKAEKCLGEMLRHIMPHWQ